MNAIHVHDGRIVELLESHGKLKKGMVGFYFKCICGTGFVDIVNKIVYSLAPYVEIKLAVDAELHLTWPATVVEVKNIQ